MFNNFLTNRLQYIRGYFKNQDKSYEYHYYIDRVVPIFDRKASRSWLTGQNYSKNKSPRCSADSKITFEFWGLLTSENPLI